MQIRIVVLGIVALLVSSIYSQSTPWDKRIDVQVNSHLNSRILSAVSPQTLLGYTEQGLKDSFRSADESQNAMSFSLGVIFQRERGKAFRVGFGFNRWGFNRVKEGNMYRYQPHPDLELYANLAEGPIQRMIYQFQQDYLSLDAAFFRRLDGAKMQIPKTELYWIASASLGVLVNDVVNIETQGFSLAEGKEVEVYDFTTSFSESGELLVNPVQNPALTGFIHTGIRAEYQLDEKFRLLLEPNVGMSLLPVFTGTQTANAVRIGCSVGVVYPID